MGLRGVVLIFFALAAFFEPLHAQVQPPSETLVLTSKSAATWSQGRENVVLLRGPVTIALDRARLSADGAVIWLAPAGPGDIQTLDLHIALIGHAKAEQLSGERVESTRSGNQLFVATQARGDKIRIVADERIAHDESATALYHEATAVRGRGEATAVTNSTARAPLTNVPATSPRARSSTAPATRPTTMAPVLFEAVNLETTNQTDTGTVDIILSDGVKLVQSRDNGDLIEMVADRAVLFTPLKTLKELQQTGGKKQGRNIITSAYLEGDVRINFLASKPGSAEQRLTAERVYYEFATDRAVLTDAVVHTIEPARQTPMILRARLVRQLSQGEYTANNIQLTTSQFALPSLSLNADRVYVRTEPTGDPLVGDRVIYEADNTTFRAFDVPFFFLPHTSGSMEKGSALRNISAGQLYDFGTSFQTEWGLFESLGQLPPQSLDVNYRLDYFSQRGPAFGANAQYGGGFLTDTTKQPWDFEGDFQSYFVYDKGHDDLGRLPVRVNHPEDLRGQALFEHQHFFPDNWQVQLRAGYVSDATFMEQWFRRDFQDGPPRDLMGYIKHQQDTEAFTFGATYQPNHLVTTSNQVQEQFEVDRLPQVGYYREGDSILGDSLTLFSENTASGLHYNFSRATLKEQGFAPPSITPGQPAQGYTGVTKTVVWRGDFRQEMDFPFTAGPLRVTPYVMGRYTQYSTSPQEAERSRGLAGAGARITTELWKVDPTAENELLDIHQIRHVIEPEVNLFTSAMNVQRNQVFVFDPQVDAINDISAAQFALHQRWETKRGGPGAWRSVDVFSLNVDVDYFGNKPTKKFRAPFDFRGLYFAAYPEESIPRDAVNADASWRLTDNTVLLADTSFNLDRSNLQTLGIGLLVRRDTRLSYFVSNRYVADLNSNITGIHVDYQMTPKYTLDLDQQFDFTQGQNVYSSAALVRQFDTFFMAIRYYVDETTNQKGVSFNIFPSGLGQGLDTSAFSTFRR